MIPSECTPGFSRPYTYEFRCNPCASDETGTRFRNSHPCSERVVRLIFLTRGCRCSIVVSIPACRAGYLGSILGNSVKGGSSLMSPPRAKHILNTFLAPSHPLPLKSPYGVYSVVRGARRISPYYLLLVHSWLFLAYPQYFPRSLTSSTP